MSSATASQVVLASASPRRLQLCSQLGLECEVRPVDIDETAREGEHPVDYVRRLAHDKAVACLERLPGQLAQSAVLGSDTIVEIDGELLGKPADAEHARRMLARLSGNTHRVHTAVALAWQGEVRDRVSSSVIEFARLDVDDIDRYVDCGEPMDKAGAYAIQGVAAKFIVRLDGSYSGVMGLPLYETASLFASFGFKL